MVDTRWTRSIIGVVGAEIGVGIYGHFGNLASLIVGTFTALQFLNEGIRRLLMLCPFLGSLTNAGHLVYLADRFLPFGCFQLLLSRCVVRPRLRRRRLFFNCNVVTNFAGPLGVTCPLSTAGPVQRKIQLACNSNPCLRFAHHRFRLDTQGTSDGVTSVDFLRLFLRGSTSLSNRFTKVRVGCGAISFVLADRVIQISLRPRLKLRLAVRRRFR